jgi:uncharacterized protein YvpB
MIFNIPFFKQKDNTDCGISALKMAFAYLGQEIEEREIEKLAGKKPGKGLGTINLSIASAKKGFKTKFFSKTINFNPENLKMDFYKKFAASDLINESNKLANEARQAGAELVEKSIELNELLGHVKENSAVIVLLDWNTLLQKQGYQGHFVVITGFDKESIYVHNSSINNPEKNKKIKKELFEKARKASGTDEDILIISNNNI